MQSTDSTESYAYAKSKDLVYHHKMKQKWLTLMMLQKKT